VPGHSERQGSIGKRRRCAPLKGVVILALAIDIRFIK